MILLHDFDKRQKGKKVYLRITKIEKLFGDHFPQILKSITFDNGSEFARYADIETLPRTNTQRASVYFAHPYRSCERGCNENYNGLIRRYIKKGTDINSLSKNTFRA